MIWITRKDVKVDRVAYIQTIELSRIKSSDNGTSASKDPQVFFASLRHFLARSAIKIFDRRDRKDAPSSPRKFESLFHCSEPVATTETASKDPQVFFACFAAFLSDLCGQDL